MATVNDVIAYARSKAQTDSNGISDASGLLWTNDALSDVTRQMLDRSIDAAQTQESYTPLTANVPNTYAWPTNMYKLKTIEVDWTGTGGQNYLQAQMLDVANIQGVSFDYLRKNQTQQSPLFDNRGDTFEIFPNSTVATGTIRIFYWLTATDYATVGDTINYPQSLDYRILGAFVVANYYESLESWDSAQMWMAKYQSMLNKTINVLAPSSQQPIQPVPLQLTGWNF